MIIVLIIVFGGLRCYCDYWGGPTTFSCHSPEKAIESLLAPKFCFVFLTNLEKWEQFVALDLERFSEVPVYISLPFR